jgi:hypothetical protein
MCIALLFAAFHHHSNRFLKAEQHRNDAVELVSSSAEFDQIAGCHDARRVSELETTIAVKEVISHMDGTTQKIWQGRQYGYSWREISTCLPDDLMRPGHGAELGQLTARGASLVDPRVALRYE